MGIDESLMKLELDYEMSKNHATSTNHKWWYCSFFAKHGEVLEPTIS
jgi:hypothetical protein